MAFGFTATPGTPTANPVVFTLPLPLDTQELISGSGLVDSFPFNTTRSSLFSYRIIKPNVGTVTLSVSSIVPHPGASVEILINIREDQFSGINLSAYQNMSITSATSWSQVLTGLPAGIYYADFEILDNQANALQSFTVTGTWDDTLSDANEPNFSLKTARQLQLGVASSNKLTLNDVDWFKFSTTGVDQYDYKGAALSFSNMTQAPSATPGIVVDVFSVDLNGNIGSQLSTTGHLNVSTLAPVTKRLQPTAPGSYAVRVKYLAGEYTSYDLTVSQFSVQPDSYEDDGTSASATTLANGLTSAGHTITGSNEDWFKVVLTSPSVLTMSFTNITISDYLQYPTLLFSVVSGGLFFEDFYQEFIGAESSPTSNAIFATSVTRSTTTALPTGTHYIQVFGGVDTYDLTVTW